MVSVVLRDNCKMILPYGNDLGPKRSRGNIRSVRGERKALHSPPFCVIFFQFIKSDFGSLSFLKFGGLGVAVEGKG